MCQTTNIHACIVDKCSRSAQSSAQREVLTAAVKDREDFERGRYSHKQPKRLSWLHAHLCMYLPIAVNAAIIAKDAVSFTMYQEVLAKPPDTWGWCTARFALVPDAPLMGLRIGEVH
jgi:hypothetical protein